MSRRVAALFAISFAAIFVVVLCLIFRPNGDVGAFIQHPATVGWAQLFGALGAIAATWIAGRDALTANRMTTRKADYEHRERAMRALISGAAFLRHALAEADRTGLEKKWGTETVRIAKADLAGAMGILKGVRLDELPNVRLVASGIGLQKLGFRSEVFFDAISNAVVQGKTTPPDILSEMSSAIAAACTELDQSVKSVRDSFKE